MWYCDGTDNSPGYAINLGCQAAVDTMLSPGRSSASPTVQASTPHPCFPENERQHLTCVKKWSLPTEKGTELPSQASCPPLPKPGMAPISHNVRRHFFPQHKMKETTLGKTFQFLDSYHQFVVSIFMFPTKRSGQVDREESGRRI